MIPRPDKAAIRAVATLASAATTAAGDVSGHVTDTAARVLGLLDGAERLIARTDAVLDRVEAVTTRVDALVTRGEGLLDTGEPVIARGAPIAGRLVAEMGDAEVDAVIRLMKRTPELLDHVDDTVLPTVRGLADVGPDIKELLAAVSTLRDLVEALPGMGRVKRRVERHDHEGEQAHGDG